MGGHNDVRNTETGMTARLGDELMKKQKVMLLVNDTTYFEQNGFQIGVRADASRAEV